MKSVAQVAYETWIGTVGFDGLVPWNELPESIKLHWVQTANAVIKLCEGSMHG